MRKVVKSFSSQSLNVKNSFLIKSPVYSDHRGSLYEAFHCLKAESDCVVSSLHGLYPKVNHVYGPYSTRGDETIYVIRGKLFLVLIDGSDHKVVDYLSLVPGDIVRVPSLSIKTFIGLEEGTCMDIIRTSGDGEHKCYEMNDKKLNIKWPKGELIHTDIFSSNCSVESNDSPDFVIFGLGLIGKAFADAIEKQGYTWKQLKARLHQHDAIKNQLQILKPKISVIVSCGAGTRPNTGWCETNRKETVDLNVTSQLAVARICKELGIHCTLVTTAAFYNYDTNHKINGQGFTEQDPANVDNSLYYKMRIIEEKLLYTNNYKILNLRIVYPITDSNVPPSLIGKLLSFSKVNSTPTSISVLPSLCPLAIKLMIKKDTGIYNFVNKGTITNGDILRYYKEIVDQSITINEEIIDETKCRCNANIIPQNLINIFGDEVEDVHKAVKDIMISLKNKK